MQTAPISLYFGVEEGQHASLEAIAKATVEWVDVVRDLAAFIDPTVEIRVEFVESEDGSVWLRNLIKAVGEGDPKALKAVAIGIILFFGIGPALHLQEDFGDWFWELFGHEHEQEEPGEKPDDLSVEEFDENEREAIVVKVKEAVEKTNVLEKRRRVILEAEKDPRIGSVGVDFVPRIEGPRVRIGREQFPAYGAEPDSAAPPPSQKDVRYDLGVDVVIVRPTLRENDLKPRWRFRQQDRGEWSADIVDEEFLWALRNDRTGLSMAVGQHMKVDVAIDLALIDGAWVEANRRVYRVIEPAIERRQGSMDL